MKINRAFRYRLIPAVRSSVLAANYWLNNYEEVIWLIGDGRSGTTWVSDLLEYKARYRVMFEPFHPQVRYREVFRPFRPRSVNLLPNQYVRPNGSNRQMLNIASDVFNGNLLSQRVDAGNRHVLYKGLLIKDIFANLLARWAFQNFPTVKIILLIRNPFAVALSKNRTRDWFWMTDPRDFLDQSDLREDYLQPFEDLINSVSSSDDYIQRQILIWSIVNYVPLLQFQQGQIHVVFYEDLYTDANREFSKISGYLWPDRNEHKVDIPEAIVRRPSRVADTASNVMAGTSPVSSWKEGLTTAEVDAGLEILGSFGFERLYGEDAMPNRAVLQSITQNA